MSVDYHPLDFDTIKKGDVIPVERLEQVTSRKYGTRKYDLALLGLRERIMQELAMRNRPATVCCLHGSLKVLTDEEALEYNPTHFRLGFRKLLRSHRRLLNVEVTTLDDGQKAKLEQTIIVQGKMIAAARSARRLALKSHTRTTPGLPKPPAA